MKALITGLLQSIGLNRQDNAFDTLSRQLLEFSGAFSTITDVNQLVPTIIGKIRDIMNAGEAALFLRSANGERFDLAYSRDVELNPRLRIRGSYHFTSNDKIVRWLLTNRTAFAMSSMTDVFSYFPEDERDIIRFVGTELCFGLEAHNRFIGMLTLGRKRDGKEYQDIEIKLLSTITALAALALENTRLQMEALEQVRAKRELEIAGELQRRLLPSAPPTCYPQLDIAGLCIPSTEVGGDYFDFFELSETELGIVIGDVAGHGMSAGMLMGMAKSCISTAIKINSSVPQIMHALNAIIYDLEDRTAMMTCIFGVLNMEQNTLTFSNAGHLYPYYFRAREDRLSCVESTSYPLGIRADMNFPICQVKLEKGDFVLACSDGFIEAENRKNEMYGYDRLERVINENRTRSAAQLADAIKDDFSRFLGGQPHSDDLTLIVVRMK